MGVVENSQDTEVIASVLGKSLGICDLQGLGLADREQVFFSSRKDKMKA